MYVNPALHAGDRPMTGMPHELGAATSAQALHDAASSTRRTYGAKYDSRPLLGLASCASMPTLKLRGPRTATGTS